MQIAVWIHIQQPRHGSFIPCERGTVSIAAVSSHLCEAPFNFRTMCICFWALCSYHQPYEDLILSNWPFLSGKQISAFRQGGSVKSRVGVRGCRTSPVEPAQVSSRLWGKASKFLSDQQFGLGQVTLSVTLCFFTPRVFVRQNYMLFIFSLTFCPWWRQVLPLPEPGSAAGVFPLPVDAKCFVVGGHVTVGVLML